MVDGPLILLGGLLGSAHCIGMCGGLAITLGLPARSASAAFARQLVYTAGRLFTYGIFGAIAGFAGARRVSVSGNLINSTAILSILAGTLRVVQGLEAACFRIVSSWLTKRNGALAAASGCLAGSMFRPFLTSPGWLPAFLAGLLTGFLPCGLLYGFVALAASRGDLLGGASVMILFGAGTMPAMILTGVGTRLLSLNWRKRLLRGAAWAVLLTGLLAIGRGVFAFDTHTQHATIACPFCEVSPEPPATLANPTGIRAE